MASPRNVLQKPLRSLDDLGGQLAFYIGVVAAIPRSVRRYRKEILRILREEPAGTISICAVGPMTNMAMAAAGDETFFDGVTTADDLPFVVPDDVITAEVDGGAFALQKDAAMRAHPTQILVDGPFFALSNNVGQRAFGTEHFVLARGPRGAGVGPLGREDDLFAGL